MAGIYIHIPFCKQACFYCDFHFSTSLKKKDTIIAAIIKELELRHETFTNTTVDTIYFGGGTPSLLSNAELESIIDAIYSNFTVHLNPEITLEANPDDLTPRRIEQLSKTRINRLSIGVQSFFELHLKQMNRAHNAKEAKTCLTYATRYFNNITIDLIYGIPDMTMEQWQENLDIALSFNVNHISSYALTVEPKTALDRFVKTGKYPPIDDTLALAHFNYLIKKTAEAGFVHYEISNFGKEHYFSRHNTAYWQGKPYLGVGPSAHSFSATTRRWNIANNTKYIEAITNNKLPSTVEHLSVQDRYNEYIMTGLRTIWGVSLSKIESDFGVDYVTYLNKLSQSYINKGLLISVVQNIENKQEQVLKTTNKGKFLVDGIASQLFKI